MIAHIMQVLSFMSRCLGLDVASDGAQQTDCRLNTRLDVRTHRSPKDSAHSINLLVMVRGMATGFGLDVQAVFGLTGTVLERDK